MSLHKLSAITVALLLTNTLSFAAPAGVTTSMMGGEHFSSWNDFMFPIANNEAHNLYTDLQLEGSSSESGIISVGGGYRQAYASSRIWGGYLFLDRERTAAHSYFTSLGPGVELLSPTWRYRINGYFPIGDKKVVAEEGWADEFGNYSFESFTGHDQLDRRAYDYEQISYGGDASVDYRFANDKRWEVGITPYAYRMSEETNMYGGKAQVSYYVNEHLSYSLSDGYDNKNKNRVNFGVSFSFGGRSTEEDSTADMLMTPVYRNLNVNTTDDGIPVDDYYTYSGQDEVENDNIYFVTNGSGNQATATTPDGTYENPYTDMSEISGADSSATIWVAGTGTAYTDDSTITLTGTQTIEGRTSDYKRAATGDDRPVITSEGLVITSANDVSDLILQGEGFNSSNSEQAGITINSSSDSAQVAQIDDVKVGTTNESTSYQNGIWMNAGAKASITNSVIKGYLGDDSATSGEQATGISLSGDGNLTINNSTVKGETDGETGIAAGIYALGTTRGAGAVTITNSTINATTSDGDAYGIVNAYEDLTMTNNTINVNAVEDGFTRASGIYLAATDATITGNTITVNSDDQGDGVYVLSSGPDDVVFSNNVVNVNADDNASGFIFLNSSGSASATVTNNTFNITSSSDPGGDADGIVDPYGNVTYSGNTFNLSAYDENEIVN